MIYRVQKRIINNYYVEVDANSPEEAIIKAVNNDHGPGEPASDDEDGDNYKPSEWRVYGTGFESAGYHEINWGINRNVIRKSLNE